MSSNPALKRVTDLFVEGAEVILKDDPADPVLLWVNKLNSFEREEANRDGHAARSLTILAVKDSTKPEWAQHQSALAQMSEDDLREQIVASQENEFFVAAFESIRQDPEWRDRVEAMNRARSDMRDDESEALAALNVEYTTELTNRVALRKENAMLELRGLDLQSLKDKYSEAWLDTRAYSSFQREYNKTQLYFSVRDCSATAQDWGWDHSKCNGHTQRLLTSREEVVTLPDGLLTKLQDAAQKVQVSVSDARFSDALASSSGSSAQPSELEESTPSIPVEMSPELAPTS